MYKNFFGGLAIIWTCLAAPFAFAADAPLVSSDPVLEKRVASIAEELRCLVCQNQTIADSHAELAIDLKNQVREMLQRGMDEKEIKRYMVDRYGDFVLYRPQMKSSTWLLWLGPFVLLIGALVFSFFKLRQRGRKIAVSDDGMTPESMRRAEKLLGISKGDAVNSPSSQKEKA